jgi:phage/plasmid-like protein (TIGR03299 family)
MSHELDFSTGEAAIAYTGTNVPWHGLGFNLEKGASIEDWSKAARMEWEIFRAPVKFDVVNDIANVDELTKTLIYPDKHVLYRSDTNSPLSVVSPSYNIVQPQEVLEFYRDLVGTADMQLETAGVLFGGRRFWALANTGRMVDLAGTKVDGKTIPDTVKGYLLLTTSCDGTLATTAQFTSVRVVCNNTLSVATKDNNTRIRVPHNRVWKPSEVKEQLGFVDEGWNKFSQQLKLLSQATAPRDRAVEYLVTLFGDLDVVQRPKPAGNREGENDAFLKASQDWWDETIASQSPAVTQKCANIWSLFSGEGMGSDYTSSDGTWFGLMNAITETMDYHTSHRTTDSRLNNSWYGAGNALKTKAFELALDYATV